MGTVYAPFTEETCTGTGATITLTGAVADRIPFSRNFNVGDPVAYTIVDGSNIVSGIGEYSAANQITRYDLFQDNGTTSTLYPGSNLTLSGGTHNIKCEMMPTDNGFAPVRYNTRAFLGPCGSYGSSFAGFAANTLYYQKMRLEEGDAFTVLGLNVSGSAGGSARVGIYAPNENGEPGKLIVDSGVIDTTATGDRENTGLDFKLLPGTYFAAVVSDTNIDLTASTNNELIMNVGSNSGNLPIMHYSTSFTFAALPDPAQLTSLGTNTSRAFMLYAE